MVPEEVFNKRLRAAHFLAVDMFQRKLLSDGATLYDLAGVEDPFPSEAPRLSLNSFNRCVLVVSAKQWKSVEGFRQEREGWFSMVEEIITDEYGPGASSPRLPMPHLERDVSRVDVWRSESSASTKEPAKENLRKMRRAMFGATNAHKDKLNKILEKVAAGEKPSLRLRSPGIESVHLGIRFDGGTKKRISARRVGLICTESRSGIEVCDGSRNGSRGRKKRNDIHSAPLLFKDGHRAFYEA